jgi:YVTN family beta-propeller protein
MHSTGFFPRCVLILAIAVLTCQAGAAETVVATIPQPGSPNRIAVDLLTGLAYVADSGVGTVSVIDARTDSQVNTIFVGIDPVGVGVNPVTSRLYVSDIILNLVFVIDTRSNQVIASIPLAGSVAAVAVNVRTNRVYVNEFGAAVVAVIDGRTNTQIATITGPAAPNQLAINEFTDRLYISDTDPFQGGVAVVDLKTNQVITEVHTAGQDTIGVAVDFVRDLIYAGDNNGILNLIDGRTNTLVQTLILENGVADVAVNPFTRRVYVTNFTLDQVDIVDGKSLSRVSSLPTGAGPSTAAIDPVRKKLYVSNFEGASVTLISTRKHKARDRSSDDASDEKADF